MLFAVIVATLCASIAVSIAVIGQALVQRSRLDVHARKRSIAEYARRSGGVVTPRMIAHELGVTPLEADQLLRSMVDDVYLTMEIDAQEGELRFSFPQLTKELEESSAKTRRKSSLRDR